MTNSRRMFLVFLWLGGALVVNAQNHETPEELAFQAAARSFQDHFFERAEKELGEFVQNHPASEKSPEAILLQAQSRYQLGQYSDTVSLLSTNVSRAGKIADQYRFWISEALYQHGDYAAAAAAYAQLLKECPESSLRSNACFGEAMSWFKQGNLTNTISLLRQPDGTFQKLAQSLPKDEFVARGLLLLAEAFLVHKEYAQAEVTVKALDHGALIPHLAWQRQCLLTRILLADQRPQVALTNLTNLVLSASATGSKASLSETILLQSAVLRANQQPALAIQVLEQHLASLLPDQRRQGILTLAELYLVQTNLDSAINNLEHFLQQYPQDSAVAQVRLALGELQLNDFYALRAAPSQTNLAQQTALSQRRLLQAQTNFDLLIAGFPQSPLTGLALLKRGWCRWEAGQAAESLADFKAATETLPLSTNQVLARFKLADVQFDLKDFTNAHDNYRQVLEAAASLSGVPPDLQENALYKRVRTSTELGRVSEATNALELLLARFPQSALGDRSLLLIGQFLERENQPAAARQKLDELKRRFAQSPLIPEAQLALAQTYIRERDWDRALPVYDTWVTANTNHPVLARVEFDRAWLNSLAGRETNALHLFTTYVARFPRSPQAPLAQYWVANFYYHQGQFVDAEKNYQLLYQNPNWSLGDLTYRARLAEGRAAYARQGFTDAAKDFTALINLLISNTNSPTPLLSEAYLALGDTLIASTAAESANALNRFAEAINAFSHVPPNDRLAPQAWGLIANCHLQLATQDPTRYSQAITNYVRVMQWTNADVAARSQAEVGLAKVYEKLAATKAGLEQTALVNQALDHYLNVVEGKNLNPGERPDLFWLWKSGQEASQILKNQSKWRELVNLYRRLMDLLPHLRGVLEKKLEEARQQVT